MSLQGLEGRVAVVTGASAGIGRATAEALVERGARVVINARRQDRLGALADELNKKLGTERVAVAAGDAADETVIDAALDLAQERFGGPVDLVVVNAGRGLAGSVSDSDESAWEEVIRTNLMGAAKLMRRAAARMRSDAEGKADWPNTPRDIVVISSNVGKHISPFSSMYGSTKFAVSSLAEALRRELAPSGVRVTAICPGVVESEFQGVAGYDPGTFGEFMERIGPVLRPEDVAGLIAHICAQPANVHLCDVVIRPTRQEYP